MNFKRKTPFIRRIPPSGGQFYTFQSAAEDLSLNLNEGSDRKFRFSKFALLNIPKIEKGNGIKNTFKLNSTIGGFLRYRTELSNDINLHFINSFQNYCLNLETMLLADSNYKQELPQTVAERVFFKWLKEHSAIRFKEFETEGLDAIRYSEANSTTTDYEKVVKFIGDIDLSGNIYSNNSTYTEVIINITSDCGSIENVLFKTVIDENYYPGKMVFREGEGLDNEIIFGRKYNDLHPDKIDIRAQYDIDFEINPEYIDQQTNPSEFNTYITNNGIKLFKKKPYNPGTSIINGDYYGNHWWFNSITGKNGYVLEDEFTNPTDEYYCITDDNSPGSIDINSIKFIRNKLDGITIDFDLENYKKIYCYKNLNSLHDLGRLSESQDFDFNTVLLYYDVYENISKEDENGNIYYEQNVLATNLFGVLFLDDVTSYSESGGQIKPFSKFKSNDLLNKNGNEFSFKINLRIDINNPLEIVATSGTTKDYVVNENNTLAMSLFFESLQEMVKVSSFIEDNELRFLEQENRIRRLEDKGSYELLNSRLTNIENQIFSIKNSNLIDYSSQIQTLFNLVNDLTNRYYNLLKNNTELKVNFDLGNLNAGSGIEIKKNDNIITLNSKHNYFNYSEKPIINKNDFIVKSLKNSNNRYLTYEVELLEGNNYLRFINNEDNVYRPEYDIIFYIKDDRFDWQTGQTFRFFFDSSFDLFSNGSDKTIRFITDFKNKLKSKENYSKTIKIISHTDGIGYAKKIPLIEIHCLDAIKFEFFVDLF